MTDVSKATQRAEILQLLIAARGEWVSLLEIRNCACQYNARILELRRLGFRIENKIREISGKRLSWFRLSNSPTKAAPVAVAGPVRLNGDRITDTGPDSASGEGSLFGDLAPQRRHPD